MNYLELFKEVDRLDGGDNFCCLCYHHGGATQFICENHYPMLFVLQGALEMRFNYNSCRINAGELSVIDMPAMTGYHPADNTVVLVYTPPQRLSDFLGRCGRVYEASFSQFVPILPSLSEWISTLLEDSARGVRRVAEEAHEQRRELARIFMAYPRRTLGELYTAFSACALGDCAKCLQEACVTQKEE